MFYKSFINHRKKLFNLLKKSSSENFYCKLQIKNILMLTDFKKSHALTFKVLKSVCIFESTNGFNL